MANLYKSKTNGDWNTASTWDLHSGGNGSDGHVPLTTDAVIFDAAATGTCTITATATNAILSLVMTGYTKTLTHSAGTLTVAGTVTLVGYVASDDAAIIVITATTTLTTGGCLMGSVTYNKSGGTLTLGDNYASRAGPMCFLQITAGGINVAGFTVSGNSAGNRLLVRTTAWGGTAKTVTVTTGTFAFCDFQDIAFASANNQPATAGTTGDCGGCTISGGGSLVFTAASAQAWTNANSGSWSTVGNWTSRIPLPQDTITWCAMNAGQTITIDMPRLPGTSFAAGTNTPTITMNQTGMTYSWYGSLNLTGLGTVTSNRAQYMISRASVSITSAGKTLTSSTFDAYMVASAPNDVLTLADAFACGTVLTRRAGVLTAVGNVSCSRYVGTAGATTNLGAGTWTVTTSGAVWAESGTSVGDTSTIAITYTGATACTFAGGAGNIYNNITIAPGGATLTFSDAFTFANMTMASAGTKPVIFTIGTNYTMTGTSFLSGTAGNVITITSTAAGTSFHLLKASGVVNSDFLSLRDSHAEGGATWYAGNGSTDVSGNNGWIFHLLSASIIGVGGGSATGRAVAALTAAIACVGGGSVAGAAYAVLASAITGAGGGSVAGAAYGTLAAAITGAGGGSATGRAVAVLAASITGVGGGSAAGSSYATLAAVITGVGGGSAAGSAVAAGGVTGYAPRRVTWVRRGPKLTPGG